MNVISMVILAIQAMQRSLLFAANFLWNSSAHEFFRHWIPLVSIQHFVCFLCSFARMVGCRCLVGCAETCLFMIFLLFLTGTHYHFIREIPMLACYEVRTSIAAWDQKWVRKYHYYELLVRN